MKELDLLLTRYLDRHWLLADTTERAAFERLLDLPDPVLVAYLLGDELPPPELAAPVQRLRAH
jgi:succinate dehydrogenase flavin-adding protein (antitoxin of CptAB toxin-antitoxin module)